MTKILGKIIILFSCHVASHAAEMVEKESIPLYALAQRYVNAMEDAGQCADVATDMRLRTEIFDLFSDDLVKIVNKSDVLAPHQSSEEECLDQREVLIRQLTKAREAYGKWTFPKENIDLFDVEGEYKIALQAQAICENGIEILVSKIIDFNSDDKISVIEDCTIIHTSESILQEEVV